MDLGAQGSEDSKSDQKVGLYGSLVISESCFKILRPFANSLGTRNIVNVLTKTMVKYSQQLYYIG